jgi:hypothetical protein
VPPTALPDVISDPGHPDNFDTDGGAPARPDPEPGWVWAFYPA